MAAKAVMATQAGVDRCGRGHCSHRALRGVHAGPLCSSAEGERRGGYLPARQALGSGAGDRSGNSSSSGILFGWVGVAAFARRALLAVPTVQEVGDVRFSTWVDELVEQLDRLGVEGSC